MKRCTNRSGFVWTNIVHAGQISFTGLQLKLVLFLLFVHLRFGLGPKPAWICSLFYPCRLKSGLKPRHSRAGEASGGRLADYRNHRQMGLPAARMSGEEARWRGCDEEDKEGGVWLRWWWKWLAIGDEEDGGGAAKARARVVEMLWVVKGMMDSLGYWEIEIGEEEGRTREMLLWWCVEFLCVDVKAQRAKKWEEEKLRVGEEKRGERANRRKEKERRWPRR